MRLDTHSEARPNISQPLQAQLSSTVAVVGRMARQHCVVGSLEIIGDITLYDRFRLAYRLELSTDVSDVELVLAAYQRWGRHCPAYLNGDFAFVVYDHDDGSALVARDQIGVCPLFYQLVGERMVVAASIRELLALQAQEPEIDDDLILSFLTYRHVRSGSQTGYKSIKRLQPAHLMVCDDGSFETQCYWQAEKIPPLQHKDDETFVRHGRYLLDLAVRDRSIDMDDGLGLHVSGGLDSSAVAILSCLARRGRSLADPIGLAWQRYDKMQPLDPASAAIRAVKQHLGIEVAVAEPSTSDLRSLLALDWLSDFDVEPLQNEGVLQDRAAPLGLHTILSGWGGDELLSFNGVGLASQYASEWRWRDLESLGRGSGALGIARGIRTAFVEHGARRRQAHKLGPHASSLASPEALRSAVTQAPKPAISECPRETQFWLLDRGHLTNRIEAWAESGARQGIRYRYPLLDLRVVEFALAVPTHLYRQEGKNRWLMREILSGLVPDVIRMNAPKREPRRVAQLQAKLCQAMREIGEQLGNGDQYQRAHLLDMDRLRQELRSAHPTKTKNLGCLRKALQVLDW